MSPASGFADQGLVTTAVVSGGTRDLSGDVRTRLAERGIETRFPVSATCAALDFPGGPDADIDGNATGRGGFGAHRGADEDSAAFTAVDAGSTRIEAPVTSQGTDPNGNKNPDTRTQIRLTVADPGTRLDVSVHSDARAGTDIESSAIDDFRISTN